MITKRLDLWKIFIDIFTMEYSTEEYLVVCHGYSNAIFRMAQSEIMVMTLDFFESVHLLQCHCFGYPLKNNCLNFFLYLFR
jgi:hypothetical protein